jgi:acetyl-CoA carboxylase beta subunit
MIDMVVPRSDLREKLGLLISYLAPKPEKKAAA